MLLHLHLAPRYALALALLITLAILCLILQPAAALAQEAADATRVEVPIGLWIDHSAGIVASIVMAAFAWLLRRLPGNIVAIIQTMRADQLLEKAINYGVNAVADATRDKTLSVNVGNAVVAQAAQYAVNRGPGALVNWMGGEAAIKQMIIARLQLPEKASVQPSSATGVKIVG